MTIQTFLRQRRKAIVAAVVAVVSGYAAKHQFDLTADQVTLLTALLTSITVYLVPNQQPAEGE